MVSDLGTWLLKRDAQLREVMTEELESLIIEGKTYHQNAVRNWKNKPKWRLQSEESKKELRSTLEVTGDARQIWLYVDQGTGTHGESGSPYWIFPRSPGGRLAFQGGYNAKTRPIAKANVGDGGRSGDWVTSAGVLHPGIKGREFSQTFIERILRPNLKKRIVKRVRRS